MAFSKDSRFDGDVLPDSTWGICKIHSPSSVIRLVDEQGRPAANGLCQMCWEESRDDRYFNCPIHGTNLKAPGRDGCPFKAQNADGQWVDCLGKGGGPTEDEIAREAESYNRLWPGGAPVGKDVLDAPEPRPPIERDREAGPSAKSSPEPPVRHDRGGVDDGQSWRDSFLDP